jgi:hypothetical protein
MLVFCCDAPVYSAWPPCFPGSADPLGEPCRILCKRAGRVRAGRTHGNSCGRQAGSGRLAPGPKGTARAECDLRRLHRQAGAHAQRVSIGDAAARRERRVERPVRSVDEFQPHVARARPGRDRRADGRRAAERHRLLLCLSVAVRGSREFEAHFARAGLGRYRLTHARRRGRAVVARARRSQGASRCARRLVARQLRGAAWVLPGR